MGTVADIEDVVNAIIVVGDSPVTTADFGTPVIAASHNVFTERARVYSSTNAIIEDGFAAGSGVVAQANLAFSGDFRPRTVIVGRRALTDYRITVDPVVVDGDVHTVTMKARADASSTLFTKTFTVTAATGGIDTVAEIVDQFVTDIEADGDVGGLVAASNVGDVLVIAPTSNALVSVGVATAKLTPSTTSAETVPDAMLAINNENAQHFFLQSDSRLQADVLAFAAWAEANKHIYVTATQEAGVWTTGTGDVLAQLQALSYNNTLVFAQDDADKVPGEGAVVGEWAGTRPGSSTLNGKTLTGVVATQRTATEYGNVRTKGGNYYVTRGGSGDFEPGRMVSGRRATDARGTIWLATRLEERIYGYRKRIVDGGSRIPYTDAGVTGIVGEMTGTLQEAVDVGLLVSFTINQPLVADADPNDRANGIISIPFTAVLAGEIEQITIRGYLSV